MCSYDGEGLETSSSAFLFLLRRKRRDGMCFGAMVEWIARSMIFNSLLAVVRASDEYCKEGKQQCCFGRTEWKNQDITRFMKHITADPNVIFFVELHSPV